VPTFGRQLAAPLIAAVVFAGLASAGAIALPLVGQRGLPAYAAGGCAVALGLAAVTLCVLARGRLLGFAGTGLCLAVAAVLVAAAVDRALAEAQAARDLEASAAAAAERARQEQKKVEDGKLAVAETLKQAAALKAAAAEDRARAEDAPARAAKLLQEARATEQKAAAAEERLGRERARLDAERERLDVRSKAVAAEREKVAEDVRKLEAEKNRVETARAEAAELRKQAASERAKAKEELDQAARKEKEAGQRLKKVEEGLALIKGKLRSRLPGERHAAVLALAHIGSFASSCDYDLCEVLAFDPVPELKKAALEALDKVQPQLYPLAVTLTLPPENGDSGQYIRALKRLPGLGRGGLPLIAAQVQSPSVGGVLLRDGDWHALLMAHTAALAAIAANDDGGLAMLLALPESPLATSRKGSLPGLHSSLCRAVGEHADALGKAKPAARKVIVPYFIKLLASAAEGNRQLAAESLGHFGPDAKAALPALRQMRFDPAEQVRNAVRAAIANIEGGNK
jgi:chemotaxis protein histidine kinase CheA